MTYDSRLAASARRDLLESLPPAAAFACHEFMTGPLTENPRRVGKELGTPFDGFWIARRGEYRVRYRIDEADRTVLVVAIRHRRDAYRT